MSALFDATNTLIVYSMMFGPEREKACPYCTTYLTNLDQAVGSLAGEAAFVVAARSPVQRMVEHAVARGWQNLAMLSSGHTTYNVDYSGTDRASGQDQGILNVFVRDGESIRHHWSSVEGDEPESETYFDPLDPAANLLALLPMPVRT